eukprot:6206360-Pleurochrysis_carterae.AAC.3
MTTINELDAVRPAAELCATLESLAQPQVEDTAEALTKLLTHTDVDVSFAAAVALSRLSSSTLQALLWVPLLAHLGAAGDRVASASLKERRSRILILRA